MPSLSDAHRAVLFSNPWFAELGASLHGDVYACGKVLRLTKGRMLFGRGDGGAGWYAVLEGVVRACGTSLQGKAALLDFFVPGHWFGEISLLDGLPRTHDIYAHTNSVLLKVSSADFDRLLNTHAALARGLHRLQSARLRALLAGMEAFATQTLEQRLARRLQVLASMHGASTPRGVAIDLPLSQEVLAQMMAVSRQRVSQLLKVLEDRGMIEKRVGRVVIVDGPGLKCLAEAGGPGVGG